MNANNSNAILQNVLIADATRMPATVKAAHLLQAAMLSKKNKHAQEMQRKGQAAIRKKYGPDFWKRIRAGQRPSREKKP